MNTMMLVIAILFGFVVAGGVYYGWSLFETMSSQNKTPETSQEPKEKKSKK